MPCATKVLFWFVCFSLPVEAAKAVAEMIRCIFICKQHVVALYLCK